MIDKYLKPFAKAVGLHTSYWMFIMLVTVILYEYLFRNASGDAINI